MDRKPETGSPDQPPGLGQSRASAERCLCEATSAAELAESQSRCFPQMVHLNLTERTQRTVSEACESQVAVTRGASGAQISRLADGHRKGGAPLAESGFSSHSQAGKVFPLKFSA
ncbi:unnamed protein product [Effrenium voratum]|nr:unnamed protein product [Effrenium voratum]